MTFGGTFDRYWNILVRYIECDSLSRPYDKDCLQYFTGLSGNVMSYNFLQSVQDEYFHLNSMSYRSCVRSEKGYCTIRWTPDHNVNIPYKITGQTPGNNAASTQSRAGDAGCRTDFLIIPGGHNGDMSCIVHGSRPTPTTDRYCGTELNCISGVEYSSPVYSSVKPSAMMAASTSWAAEIMSAERPSP